MPCEYLHLGIIKKDNGEPSSTISCNVYAYCEDEAHQLGPFECKFDRESILDAFERLLPRISFSSILRGSIQRPEYEETSQNPLDELTILGSKIYLLLDPIIREAIEDSDSIRLFTNEMLIPWEIMYNGQEFVSLKHPFGISPTTKRRISIRQRKKSEKLRVMLIIDPQDNLPQARIENEKIISQLKDDVRVDDPIILKGRKEAKWSQVRSYLQEESFDILHVAAHAKFNKKKDEDTGIVLSGDTVLRPRDIFYDIKGDPPWLIFMNACESAKTRDLNHFDKYDELSTLADAFVGAGASSYIGTSGIINDSSASEIAGDFYSNLLGGSTVAES